MRYKTLLIYLSVVILISLNGCCFPGSESPIEDDGAILWQGSFPHDFNKKDQIERKNTILVRVKLNKDHIGNVETRDKNLELVFVDPQGKEIKLWKYMDYGAVEKVTFSHKGKILRLYFDKAIIGIRNKHYVTELNLNNMKRRTFLIKCGEWYI